MKIAGPPSASPFRVGINMQAINPAAVFVNEMAPALWDAAVRYGIDAVVMIAQSGHETGWGGFTGNVRPWFFATAGIKIRDPNAFPGCSDGDRPLAHAQNASWEAGARAHAHHLLAYMQRPLPPGDILLDPRWVHVYGKRAPITDVEQLGGSWAPSPSYGTTVADLARKLAT